MYYQYPQPNPYTVNVQYPYTSQTLMTHQAQVATILPKIVITHSYTHPRYAVPHNNNAELMNQGNIKVQMIPPTVPQHYPSSNDGPAGLPNIGSTCYMNAALQCLFQFQALMKDLRRIVQESTAKEQNIAYWLLQVYENLAEDRQQLKVALTNFKYYFSQRNPEFSNNQQQDSPQFLTSLISEIHEDTKPRYQFKKVEFTDKDDPQKQYLEYARQHQMYEASVISHYFGSVLVNIYVCQLCKRQKYDFEEVFYLQVQLQQQINDLSRLIDTTLSVEMIENYQCDFCHKVGVTQNITKLMRPPRILICWIKRYKMKSQIMQFLSFGQSVYQKDSQELKIGQSLSVQNLIHKSASLDSVPNFQIKSVINHIGSHTSGHYVTLARFDDGWFRLDDSHTSRLNEATISQELAKSSNCYIVIYQWV